MKKPDIRRRRASAASFLLGSLATPAAELLAGRTPSRPPGGAGAQPPSVWPAP